MLKEISFFRKRFPRRSSPRRSRLPRRPHADVTAAHHPHRRGFRIAQRLNDASRNSPNAEVLLAPVEDLAAFCILYFVFCICIAHLLKISLAYFSGIGAAPASTLASKFSYPWISSALLAVSSVSAGLASLTLSPSVTVPVGLSGPPEAPLLPSPSLLKRFDFY